MKYTLIIALAALVVAMAFMTKGKGSDHISNDPLYEMYCAQSPEDCQ